MQRTLLSLAAVGTLAASLSAQCVSPTTFQTTDPFDGSTFFGTPSDNPGACAYFELDVKANVTINQLGLNFLNGGEGPFNLGPTNPNYFTPNLIGTTATVRWWMVDLTGGINGGLVLSNIPQPYDIANGVNPAAPWVLGATSTFTVQPADTPSLTSGFSLSLNAGTKWGVCLVTTPNGTALGSTAPTTNRLHPLFKNVGAGSPLLVAEDQIFKFQSRGVRSIAFAASPAGQFMPNIVMNYTLGANSAYTTSYGSGCYDRKKSFYQRFDGPANPAGAAPDITTTHPNLTMTNLGNRYFVSPGSNTYPVFPPNTSGFYTGATPQHINSIAAAQNLFGGWDDSTSVAYTLPFTMPHPAGSFTQISICSNGVVYCGPNCAAAFAAGGGRIQMFGLYQEFISGPPAFAAGFGDLWPADGTGGVGEMYIDYDAVNSRVVISWVNVREYPNTANGTFGNNFQMVLNSTGTVDYVWGNLANSDAAPVLIGYGAGDGLDPGAGLPSPRSAVPSPTGGLTGLVAAIAAGGGSFLSGNGDKPPILKTLARPQHGNSLQLQTSNLDPSIIGVLWFISFGSIPGGLDLGTAPVNLGMPGCNLYITLPEIPGLSGFDFAGGGQATALVTPSIPAVGPIDVYVQTGSISIASPAYNALNALVSNALCLHVDAN